MVYLTAERSWNFFLTVCIVRCANFTILMENSIRLIPARDFISLAQLHKDETRLLIIFNFYFREIFSEIK